MTKWDWIHRPAKVHHATMAIGLAWHDVVVGTTYPVNYRYDELVLYILPVVRPDPRNQLEQTGQAHHGPAQAFLKF